MTRETLYPALEPYETGVLEVSGGHSLYYEQSGNPTGKPVIAVHGGPGGGSQPAMRRFFNSDKYRVILFDQRGCGKSVPHASLEQNTTWDLISDMELLRQKLDIERWQVFGGSWGSTLALAYAQTHPDRVSEIVLRGIFLLRKKELDWFYQNGETGAGALYPDLWNGFLAEIEPDLRGDMITAYYAKLTSEDEAVRLSAARAWSFWEGSTLSLLPDPNRAAAFGADEFAIAMARIECHYFINKGFFDSEDQLIRNIDRIRDIPCTIVQGRYDVVTPFMSAWDLHQAWPEADFRVVNDAGHSATEPGNIHELVSATNRFA